MTSDLSFTGQNQDTVSALYDFAAREYAINSRWASPDPLGPGAFNLSDPQTLNRYGYVRGTPTILTDPLGLVNVIQCALYCRGGLGGGGGGGGWDPAENQGCIDWSCDPVPGPWNAWDGSDNPQEIPGPCPDWPGADAQFCIIIGAVPPSGINIGVVAGGSGAAAAGGAVAAGGGSQAPTSKTGCIAAAVGKGALTAGIDAIGLIPEAGGIARVIGHQAGFVGVVADQTGRSVIKAVNGAASTGKGLAGLTDTSPAGLASTGLTIAGFIPVVNDFAAVASIALDIGKTVAAVKNCN